MARLGDDGPSKKPRIDEQLVENEKLKGQVRRMEEEILRLRFFEEQKKEVEDEKKETKATMEELRTLIECPVCLMVPRKGGPVPVCTNGHIVCCTCRDRIRLDAGVEQAKCPSCMVDLGNATSLLASRLVERVKHECEQDGCKEIIPFTQLEKHQQACSFRKVLCPGNGNTCKLEMPFNKVEEHVRVCKDTWKFILSNGSACENALSQKQYCYSWRSRWPTQVVLAHKRMFFVKARREKGTYYFEAIMLGSEAECMGYLASITVQKPGKDPKVLTKSTSHPRHISLDSQGDMELILPEKALSKIWIVKEDKFVYDVKLYIEKL